MKKITLVIAGILMVVMASAQMKKDRTSAYNYWQKGDLVKAKDYIDKAIATPEAATDAKVWFYKGGIYLDIHLKPEFKILAPDALNASYEAYNKSKELDVKKEYTSDILLRLQTIGGQLFNVGIGYFENNDLDNALANFDRAVKIGKDNGIVDTLAIYGTALCYDKQGQTAKAIQVYEELVNLKMNEPSIYSSLSALYKSVGDAEKANKAVEAGLERYPGNNDLIITQANLYISTNQHEKALRSLMVAKEKEPQNISILYAIGVTYDLLKNDTTFSTADREKYLNLAIESYENTLKVDPKYFDALFNTGVIYFNKGGDEINAANKLPLSEETKYQQLITSGKNYLQKALPYFESALTVKDSDRDLLVSLKEIYTRLEMMDKLKAVNEKLQ